MDKIYTSTRDKHQSLSGKEAILKGIAEDGGLFVYDGLDALELPLPDMMKMTYEEMAELVLGMLLPDYSQEEIRDCVYKAYHNKFRKKHITPVRTIGDIHILELFHGPTCAFKDLGLCMLPQLMSVSLKTQKKKDVMILTATSGDTGKAALEGFLDVDRIGITVFYPQNGVSQIQYLQMVTTLGKNTCVCAIDGNFDDAQSSVKKIFQNTEFNKRLQSKNIVLSSANSINIGRLVPQIVYYVYAYKEMVNKGEIVCGEKINFCVPTGNYGNVLAGYYAKMLGLPIHTLIVASNENNVVYDFLQTGVYNRNRPFHKTISPSMDILISSNLERLLYYASGKDTTYVKHLMKQLEDTGTYQIKKDILQSIQSTFYGGYCDDAACEKAIHEVYEKTGYVMDPHTAVAYKVMSDYEQKDTTHKTVVVSTASPYKFATAVYKAIFKKHEEDEFYCMEELQKRTKAMIPTPLKNLEHKEISHKSQIKIDEMQEFIDTTIREIFYD